MRTMIYTLALMVLIYSCKDDKKPVQAAEVSADKRAADSASAHGMHVLGNGGYCDSVNNGLIKDDTLKGSPHRIAMATINGAHVHIEYGSPGVKGRIIWGGLVPYDKVWVTGAHKATTIRFSKAVEITGKSVAAGTYALFTIPKHDKWVVILNSQYEQHLADDYNEKEDILRMDVAMENSSMVPRLTYSIEKTGENSGSIAMSWEKVKIQIPFSAGK